MSDIAIHVENVGKRYRIGERHRYKALRDTLTNALYAPVRAAASIFNDRHTDASHNGGDNHFWSLKDVSFDIKQGDAVGIIGRNGAGKSTLLKILSRITKPTEGYIRIHGRVGSLLEVGTGFHPELTGRENIYLNGSIIGMKKKEIDRKLDEIIAFAEIEKFIDTPVKFYSSGMYIRLAFAVAAHLEPEILLVDEVLAVGDAAFQKKCLGKMGDVANQGRTVIFVSHNMNAVQSLCGRAVWLSEGSVCRDGRSDIVVSEYQNVFATHLGAERKWNWPGDAPGDDRVRLTGVRLIQGEQTTKLVDINKPARIELSFTILRDCRNLITGCSFYDMSGLCLFAHCDWRPNHLGHDHYRKSVTLPAQLFAEGRVSVLVQLVFYDPIVLSLVLPDALSFEAIDSDSPDSVRGLYSSGSWPGVVRVKLDWSSAERQ
jgi:homopolymeric O-antigen transport system ATP-binding protein